MSQANGHPTTGPARTDSDNETGTGDTSGTGDPEISALESDIERTREALAETVDQLTAKLDVKTRLRNRVMESKARATDQVQTLRDQATNEQGQPTTALFVAGGIVAGLVAIVVVTLWRRSPRNGLRTTGRSRDRGRARQRARQRR